MSLSSQALANPKATVAAVATRAALRSAEMSRTVPSDYVPLTPEGLLLFCASQLKAMDVAIAKKMHGQQALVDIQDAVTTIQTTIKEQSRGGEGFASEDVVNDITVLIDNAIKMAGAAGDDALVTNLQAVRGKLRDGGAAGVEDGTVKGEEAKEMCTMLDSALTACRSGAELSMIELQALVSKRGTGLQLATGMMNSVNEGAKNIAGNIGR